MSTDTNSWRTQPMYSYAEAAHLAHVSSSTVRNWLLGYVSRNRSVKPLLPSKTEQGPMVSFLQLIEIVVAAKFRKTERVRFEIVSAAYVNAKKQSGIEYPFADLRLEAIGGHIIQRMHGEKPEENIQTLDSPSQWTLPSLILDTVNQIDYEHELAARWYPVGRENHIVVDPRVSAGIPTIIERGVTIQAIRKRFKAGHRIDFIAQDLELTPDVVETAIRYGEQVAA